MTTTKPVTVVLPGDLVDAIESLSRCGSIGSLAGLNRVAWIGERVCALYAMRGDDPELKPRAVAVMTAMARRGSMRVTEIRSSIGDARVADTRSLLVDMRGESLIRPSDEHPGASWALDDRGLAWLRSRGILSPEE